MRLQQPVKYRRYSGKGYDGRLHIYFQFYPDHDQPRLDARIYDILNELKTLDGYPTGLRTVKSAEGPTGTRWQLPDNPVGRTAADVIDARLLNLADSIARESGRSR